MPVEREGFFARSFQMFVCMCVCVCVCMYVCMYVSVLIQKDVSEDGFAAAAAAASMSCPYVSLSTYTYSPGYEYVCM